MSYTKRFTELGKQDSATAGGKGASLGEMTQAGIPVPPGFVLLASAFEQFIETTELAVEIDATLHTVNHEEMHTVEHASKKIKALILAADMPKEITTALQQQFKTLNAKYVAVRSSATAEDSSAAAWAGQLESYLNTTEATLLDNIKKCWASLFTPRAIFYRFEKNLHKEKISVAVVVQKMVDSESSGIAFSVHPVTQDHNQLIIEAGFGLGEAIVSGQITPDSYVVEKSPLRMLEQKVHEQKKGLFRALSGGNSWQELGERGKQQVLKESEILALAKLIMKIERHYRFPVDVEWAREKGKFYITQSRPITTLTKTEQLALPKFKKEDYILSFLVRGVNVFVTDIHREGYADLEVLYIIDNGLFKQYFTKRAYQRALNKGLKFYGDKQAVRNYQKDLSDQNEQFKKFFNMHVKDKKRFSKSTLQTFFRYTAYLCEEYAKMNFEYTDKAFANKDKNKVVAENLKIITSFKDKVRAFMNSVLFEDNGYLSYVFNVISKQFSLPIAVLENLTQQELLDLYQNKKPNKKKVLQRQEAFVVSYDNPTPYQGEQAKTIAKSFEEKAMMTNEIKGQTANKGKITGKVKIIPVDYSSFTRINAEIEKMEQGDILVAETTAPELIVACKKAAAIITDMGGLMSHAAIVSREFAIPCIVGTKNATQILKDGDLIEVDANQGIVKILEKKIISRPILKREYARDFCLAMIESWCKGESTYPRIWTEKQQPYKPYILFEREGSTVNCYLDERGFRWIEEELRSQIKKDPDFVEKLVKKYIEVYGRTKPIWEQEKTLSHAELLDFLENDKEGWPLYEAIYFIAEMFPTASKEFKLARKALDFTDTGGDKGDKVLRKSLKKVFPELGELSSVLLIEEIASKKIPFKVELEKRMKKYFYAGDTLFIDKTRENLENFFGIELEKAQKQIVDEFKGEVGFRGKVEGRVRKLMSYSQAHLLQEGEILVTAMTTPEFSPALKKASAFVTDEGGVASHAAITAREMGKPCIIGTRIATQVLKDGDMVEVDADNGIVRILKRAQP